MLIPFTWKGADEDVGVGVGVEALAEAGVVAAGLLATSVEEVGEGLVIPNPVLSQPTNVSKRSKLTREKIAREETRW